MPRYKLLLHGQNFLIDIGEGYKKHGFWTGRYVDAIDETVAAVAAIEDFKDSEKYSELMEVALNTGYDSPFFEVEEIEQRPDNEFFDNGVLPGLAIYPIDAKKVDQIGDPSPDSYRGD